MQKPAKLETEFGKALKMRHIKFRRTFMRGCPRNAAVTGAARS